MAELLLSRITSDDVGQQTTLLTGAETETTADDIWQRILLTSADVEL